MSLWEQIVEAWRAYCKAFEEKEWVAFTSIFGGIIFLLVVMFSLILHSINKDEAHELEYHRLDVTAEGKSWTAWRVVSHDNGCAIVYLLDGTWVKVCGTYRVKDITGEHPDD